MPFGEEWDARNKKYLKQAQKEARKAENRSLLRWFAIAILVIVMVMMIRYHIL